MEPAPRSPGEHHVGPAAADDTCRLADREQPGDVAEDNGVVRATGIVGDGDVRGGHVGEMLEEPERMEIVVDRLRPNGEIKRSPRQRPSVGPLQILQIGVDHVAPDDDAEPFRGECSGRDSGVAHRQIGGGKPELDLAAHHLEALPRPHPQLRVEVGDLAAERDREAAGVEAGDRPDSRPAGEERCPEVVTADPDRTDHTDPGDDDLATTAHARNLNQSSVARKWGGIAPAFRDGRRTPDRAAAGAIGCRGWAARQSEGSSGRPAAHRPRRSRRAADSASTRSGSGAIRPNTQACPSATISRLMSRSSIHSVPRRRPCWS